MLRKSASRFSLVFVYENCKLPSLRELQITEGSVWDGRRRLFWHPKLPAFEIHRNAGKL